ncbi:hypothetical protein TSAR_012683 [Trichomalopsis sarcophagae]|uniref:Uncharacterized protein n=1 Tax=Trichomalopsis sarcophagae TaxID=543379 RepID=A0A232FLK6_9HYME|nr:hypothetical protein TSAR_012683 [Trichomalopsis sarcophagae]
MNTTPLSCFFFLILLCVELSCCSYTFTLLIVGVR